METERVSPDFEQTLLDLGHVPLKNLTKNKIIDQVIGIVTGDKPATKSRGSDFSKFLMIVDPSLYQPGENAMSLNLFKPQKNLLPDIRGVGDIILCRKLMVQEFNGKTQAVSVKAVSSWATFDGDPNAPLEPRPTTWSENIRVSDQQRNIVRALREWWHRQNAEAEAQQQALSKRNLATKSMRPLLTTSEITSDRFLDYVGEVTHNCFDSDPNRSLMTLQLTDYTENPLLQEVDLGHNLLHVTGRRVLRCSLWDQNVSAARVAHIAVGTFVFLRNARSMLDDAGHLRLAVHGDKIRPEGINVARIEEDDPRIEGLLRRRQEYRDTMAKEQMERKIREEEERRAREKAEQAQQPAYQTIIKHTSILPTRIADVLKNNAPINKYRIKARIIDMWPSRLEKLARPYCKACDFTLEPARVLDTVCPHCAAPMSRDAYIYRFVFRIEDEHGTKMSVIVCLDDANVFLPGLPPTNLYENNCTLQSLRNRLGKLCDLDAIACPLSDRPPPGNPFVDWCVKSYVPNGANRRQYRVFDTGVA